jgi:hypothetical protein
MAVGAPEGLGQTVAAGIVGARDRSVSDGVAVYFAGALFLKYLMERRRFMNSQTCDKPKGDVT